MDQKNNEHMIMRNDSGNVVCSIDLPKISYFYLRGITFNYGTKNKNFEKNSSFPMNFHREELFKEMKKRNSDSRIEAYRNDDGEIVCCFNLLQLKSYSFDKYGNIDTSPNLKGIHFLHWTTVCHIISDSEKERLSIEFQNTRQQASEYKMKNKQYKETTKKNEQNIIADSFIQSRKEEKNEENNNNIKDTFCNEEMIMKNDSGNLVCSIDLSKISYFYLWGITFNYGTTKKNFENNSSNLINWSISIKSSFPMNFHREQLFKEMKKRNSDSRIEAYRNDDGEIVCCFNLLDLKSFSFDNYSTNINTNLNLKGIHSLHETIVCQMLSDSEKERLSIEFQNTRQKASGYKMKNKRYKISF